MRAFASPRLDPSGLLIVLPIAGTGVASYLAFSPERSGSLAFWLLLCGTVAAMAAVALAWGMREGLATEWLKPKAGDFTRGWVGAAIFYLAAWLAARTVTPVGSKRHIWLVLLYEQLGDHRVLQGHPAEIGAAIVAAAAAEEIVWRGMVTQLLADRLGSRVAWRWAAGLYALAQAPTAYALRGPSGWNPILVAAALAGGFLWGGMVRRFGRLAPSIVAHALFDWAVVMMFPLWGGVWPR
jgi:membrane protease YdiL (CAAX protease family)